MVELGEGFLALKPRFYGKERDFLGQTPFLGIADPPFAFAFVASMIPLGYTHELMRNTKAKDNLEAASILLDREQYSSTASRAYYAVYLAAYHKLETLGIHPYDAEGRPKDRWLHNLLPDIARAELCLSADQKDIWEILFGSRVKADYSVEPVDPVEAAIAIEDAKTLVEVLLKNE